MKKIFYLMLTAFLVIGLASCKKDKDTKAGFSFSSENLEVSFNNTSTDATSYTWDFGDGNTSTEMSPKHTYAKSGTYTVKLTAKEDDSTDTNSQEVTVGSQYKENGYVLGSVIRSSTGNSYYAGYFETLPSDVDLTAKSAFQRIEFKTGHKGFIYGWPTDGTNGISKIAVDQSGKIVTVATIPTTEFIRGVVIINDDLGFFSYFYKNEVIAFNPKTMEVIKTISLANGKVPAGFDETGYSDMHYNPVNNKLYLTLYANKTATPQFNDLYSVIVEVVDVATQSWEKTIEQEGAMYPLLRGSQSNVTDASGNTYILCHGSYGIDGAVGPTAPAASRPQILKINANSEFEKDYAFNPINAVGFTNNFFQMATNIFVKGDKAYIIGTAKTDSPAVLALIQKLANGTITQAETQQLYGLVLYDESMKLMEVDLATKAVTAIEAFPLTAGFAYPNIQPAANGNIAVQAVSNGGTFTGFYDFNPSSNTVTQLFNITQGGVAHEFIDLGLSFE